MSELERKLAQLGREVEYPPTPDLSQAVARRVEAETETRPAARTRRAPTLRIALLASLLVLLLAGTVVAAVPQARHAVLDLLGLRAVTVERVERLSAGVETRLEQALGEPMTLERAAGELPFTPQLPGDVGQPNGVFLGRDTPGGELSLTYPPGPGLPRAKFTGVGLLVKELDGVFAPGFYGKLVPRGVRIERLRIEGDEAIWIAGPHEFFYKDAETHTFRIEQSRLAGPTLLVQRGRVMVRLEGEFDLATAIAIARSLEPF